MTSLLAAKNSAPPPGRGRRRWPLTPYTFVAPFAVVYVLFILFPVVQAVIMSFFDWDLLGGPGGAAPQWVGLENYRRMLVEDARFWNALWNTIVFTVVSTPIIAGLGLVFALGTESAGRMAGFYRAAIFLPYVLPVSVTTLIWGYLLNPSRGLVSWVLGSAGVASPAFLSDPRWAMAAIVVTTVWWTVGFNMVIFGAGLQDIDATLYEAAAIDGASRWQQFAHVTVPGLRRVTLLVLVTQVIASFQIFGQVNIMTGGGPGGKTDVLVRYIYQTGFRDQHLGYASAMSVALFVMMLAVVVLQFAMARKGGASREAA